VGHDVVPSHILGWQRLQNGGLIAAASQHGFIVMITTDQNLRYQQDTMSLPLAVIVLVARTNRKADLVPLVPELLRILTLPLARSLIEIRQP
jgi:hypothetical protein